ncbi:MAG: RNA polymerase factor sigma-54 [Candidatus Berkiellales bacterium]
MKPSLQLRLGNQLTMTPQLQHAIRLLQLSSVELQREIQSALETNTMLELAEKNQEHDIPFNDDNKRCWEYKMDVQKAKHTEFSGNAVEALNSNPYSLKDHLSWQISLASLDETDQFIAETIIDSINEDGYLTTSLDEIAATLKIFAITHRDVEAVLTLIQQCDPIGVGARNIGECLKLQLQSLHEHSHIPFYDKLCILVMQHLALLAKRDYPTLRRRLKVSAEDLKEMIRIIHTLNPRPGTAFGQKSEEYVFPDIFTYKQEQQWVVELNPECTPPLQINRDYVALIRRADLSKQNQFLGDQLKEARWFLKSIQNRNETLLKATQCIVNAQVDFLEKGEEYMQPLSLQNVAVALGLHESTISRITTQKYIHTPRGTFELKYFFSRQLSQETGNDCSATAIRALIKKMISQENQAQPLSDSKLSKLLALHGIQIARRTVTKYREGVKIPPSNERKQLC